MMTPTRRFAEILTSHIGGSVDDAEAIIKTCLRELNEIGHPLVIVEGGQSEKISLLESTLNDATDYIAYLVNNLPEDVRDNSVWLKCRAALGKDL